MSPKLTIRVQLNDDGQQVSYEKCYYMPPCPLNQDVAQTVFTNAQEVIEQIFAKAFNYQDLKPQKTYANTPKD